MMPTPVWKNALLCLALVVAPLAARADEAPPWRAAAAAVTITPAGNMWMMGSAARTKPSTGVLHDIFAKALALEDSAGNRLVIVTYDLLGVPRTLRQGLVQRCAAAFQLAPDALLLNASHTHSGPELRLRGVNGDDIDVTGEPEAEAYGRELEEKSFQIIGEVLRNLAPARLDYQHARAGFAMNRRRPTEKGFVNAQHADGPVDHAVPVLRVSSPDGREVRAVLFGYACHNTSLNLLEFSGDYAGFAQAHLEAARPGLVALFMQGCGGDQNPYPRRTPEFSQQHGRALANAVEAALDTVPRPLAGPLRVAYAEVTLEYAPLPPRAAIEERAASSNRYASGHAKWLLGLLDQDRVPTGYPCPVQVVRFGNDLVLAALGGEVVVDYALRLKRELAGPAVWVAGYSNDVFAYIPSRRVLAEGGYEAGGAVVYGRTHPGPWAPSLEERLVAKVHELNARLQAP